jgi:hypothetical protein
MATNIEGAGTSGVQVRARTFAWGSVTKMIKGIVISRFKGYDRIIAGAQDGGDLAYIVLTEICSGFDV